MKKISTLFKKDPNDLSRVINEVDPQNDWVYDGEAIPTRKFDGIAAAIINGELYKRYDVTKGRAIPKDGIPCQQPDIKSGHQPFWVKCNRSDNSDKYFFEAFDLLTNPQDGTYELCGETISTTRFEKRLNIEGYDGHVLVPHGSQVLDISDFTFDGIRNFLEKRNIEGIVFHGPNGEMCKIRRKDFGFEW